MTAGTYLLLSFVEWVCSTYPASVTSWWRSSHRNMVKGGADDSKHLTGGGVDVAYDQAAPPLQELEAVARAHFVRIVRESDHDHFQTTLPEPPPLPWRR